MTRFLLAGVTAALAVALAPSAQASVICTLAKPETCVAFAGETACGETGEKCGIRRCYYMTDYPTCLY